jgi:hypothetical protein
MPILRQKVIGEPIANLAALQALDDSSYDNGVLVNVSNLAFFKLDRASTLVADNNLIVTTSSGVGRWLNVSNWSGTPTTTIGGIISGVPVSNTTVPLVLEQLLKPYQVPSFTSFSITGVSVLEVGAQLPDTVSFQWSFSNPGNVSPNTLDITDNIISQTILSNISTTSPASYTFSSFPLIYPTGAPKRTTPGNYTFTVSADNTNLQQFTRPLNIPWDLACYSGADVNATLSNSQILALANKVLSTTFPTSVVFAGGTKYFWYWIPASFTQPTTFKDSATLLEVDMEAAVTQTVTNIFGLAFSYKGYRSTFQLINGATILVS